MNDKSNDSCNTKNLLEWSVFSLSLLLVAGVVAFLGWSTITSEDRPAAFQVQTDSPIRVSGNTVVPIRITNAGSATAAEVMIAITARYPSGEKECTLTVDFVPRGGTRYAHIVLEGLETPIFINTRVAGYIEP